LDTTGAGSWQANTALKSNFRFNDSFSLGLRADYLHRDEHSVDSAAGAAVLDRDIITNLLGISIRPKIQIDTYSRLSARIYYTLWLDRFIRDEHDADTLDTVEDSSQHLGKLELQFDRAFGERHLLTVGAEGRLEQMQSPRLGQELGRRGRVAVFAQHEWQPLDRPLLVLLPGFRLDIDSEFGVYPSPRLAIRLEPHKVINIRGSYGLGFRAPDFKELLLRFENPVTGYLVIGNPDLKPETSHGFTVNVDLEPIEQLSFHVSGYSNWIRNLIDIELLAFGTDGFDEYEYANVFSAWTRGFELGVVGRPWDFLTLQAGYMLTDTKNVTRGVPLDGRARHRVKLGILLDHRPWGLSASVRADFVGKRRFYVTGTAFGALATSPYVDLDMRIEKSFFKGRLRLFIGVQNLANAGDATLNRIPPRRAYGGIGGRFEVKKKDEMTN